MFTRLFHSSARTQNFAEARLCRYTPESPDGKSILDSAKEKATQAWSWTKDTAESAKNWTVETFDSTKRVVGPWAETQIAKMPQRIQNMWRVISQNPSVEEETKVHMLNSLQEFMLSAPAPVVDLVAFAVSKLSPEQLAPDHLDALTNHQEWIRAFKSPELVIDKTSQDFYASNDKAMHTPTLLLMTLEKQERLGLYKLYVDSFVHKDVQDEHHDVFGDSNLDPKKKMEALVANRQKIGDAMQTMISGELPQNDPDQKAQDIAFEALEKRYKSDPSLVQREAEKALRDPKALTLFNGAKKLGVFPPEVLDVINTKLTFRKEDRERTIVNVQDRMSAKDARDKAKDAANILDKMEGWEKLALLAVIGYAAVKHTKWAVGGLLVYLGIKYIGNVQDPLGAGAQKIKEGADYLKGKNQKARGVLGWDHDKTPEEMAEAMVRFAEGEDLHNIEEESEVLMTLSGKTMAELSRAFTVSKTGWNLDLKLLYGGQKNIPAYFKNQDHCRAMTGAVGYTLFALYRSNHPGDPEVKAVSDAMARLDEKTRWMDELAKPQNVQLARSYENLVVRGKMEGYQDTRQLHRFIETQVTTYSFKSPQYKPAAPGSNPNRGNKAPGSGTNAEPGKQAPGSGTNSEPGNKAPGSGKNAEPGSKAPDAGNNPDTSKDKQPPTVPGTKPEPGQKPPVEGKKAP